MAAEIQIIEDQSVIELYGSNNVVRVIDANAQAVAAQEAVEANHIEMVFDTDTNELYALWGTE